MSQSPTHTHPAALVAALVALVWLAVTAPGAVAQSSGESPALAKLDTRARIALEELRAGASPERLRARFEAVQESGMLDVFIGGTASREALEAAGAVVRAAVPGYAVAYIRPADLEAVAGLPGVTGIYGAAPVFPLLDSSVPTTHADRLRGSAPEFTGFAGQGVLVGCVDRGVFFKHRGFNAGPGDELAQTRFKGIWDQTQGQNAKWNRAAIAADNCTERDDDDPNVEGGHGTHVLSIAAGDGSEADLQERTDRYVGMAPQADLAAVKLKAVASPGDSAAWVAWSTDVVAGASWIFDEVAQGQPAVVNLSLGTDFGPHDGTSPFDSSLSALCGPGRIVVVAAGNSGVGTSHARPRPEYPQAGFRITGSSLLPQIGIVGYYECEAPSCVTPSVTITSFLPESLLIGPVPLGADTLRVLPGGEVRVAHRRVPGRRTIEVYITFRPNPESNLDGDWTLAFPGLCVPLDLWRYVPTRDNREMNDQTIWSAGFIDSMPYEGSLTEPGTAERVITVGAWASRTIATDDCHSHMKPAPWRQDMLAPFSSRGPTRDGRRKPDLVAPGVLIVAAASGDWTECLDERYRAMSGTSMAAPHVTGAVALLLQALGPASPEVIKYILTRSADTKLLGTPCGTSPYLDNSSVWSRDWGWGKLRLPALLDSVRLMVLPEEWISDCFPATEDLDLPGTWAFDTTTALIKTGVNIAAPQCSGDRPCVAGDSSIVVAPGDWTRVDMVFRILPGPGNHITRGIPSSGLRRLPTSAVACTRGDASFWGQYWANNGERGTPAGHPEGAWSPHVWNSARCDTAELNLFPVSARGNLSQLTPGAWAATYHESDPKYGTLGIEKNRCFLVDPARGVTSSNVTCGYVPEWVTSSPLAGYDGNPRTREHTKIIPDGLLTPGAHVEYFFRREDAGGPRQGTVAMCPDTNRVFPQRAEASFDGHRWQQFGVLPDRWKAIVYGGLGMATMLYVDLDDGGGNERLWVGAADSLAATRPERYGAHNGWHALGGGADVNDPAMNRRGDGQPGFVSAHLGQPGTTWDMYAVRGSRLPVLGNAGSLGSRYAFRPAVGELMGRQCLTAPTLLMLTTYYDHLLVLTGDRSRGILGPDSDRSQDDALMIEAFLETGGSYSPKGVFIEGSGFVESASEQANSGPPHALDLCRDKLGVGLIGAGYPGWVFDSRPSVPLTPSAPLQVRNLYVVRNPASSSIGEYVVWREENDLLQAVVPGQVLSQYPNWNGNGPHVASVFRPWINPGQDYLSVVDGWSIDRMSGPFEGTSITRLAYLWDVFTNVFGEWFPIVGSPEVTLDAPPAPEAPRDFLALRSPNPSRGRGFNVEFGLSRPGEVELCVYDLSGRRIRTLSSGRLEAGRHERSWDGRGEAGARSGAGVYFLRLRSEPFSAVRKLVLLP